MKVGMRTPNIKSSVKARTTGSAKRKLKRMTNPFYGKKGMGWLKNPQKALYNKIYHKTTFSVTSLGSLLFACVYYPVYWTFLATVWCLWASLIVAWWMCKGAVCVCVWAVNGIISLVEWAINRHEEGISVPEIPGAEDTQV